MNRSTRLVLTSTLAALLMVAGVACKGGTETQPANPKPPAQPSPSPTAPAPAQKPAPSEAPAAPAEEGKKEEAVKVSPEAQKEADSLFASLCSTCHGATGHGDGPAAAAFPVKPASFDTKEFQDRVSDEEMRKVIVDGGPAVGKSPLMPGNPSLKDKPEVVEALVQKIRSFGKK